MGLTWTFERDEERLILQRHMEDGSQSLVITHADSAHAIPFNDLGRLETFQSDMEKVLLSTGWLLANFSPDRRHYDDRRGFPRIDTDRRRWWTDVRERLTAITSRERRAKG